MKNKTKMITKRVNLALDGYVSNETEDPSLWKKKTVEKKKGRRIITGAIRKRVNNMQISKKIVEIKTDNIDEVVKENCINELWCQTGRVMWSR